MKGKRMCPNPACEKYTQPTGLMGGCDCGTALVRHRTLDEQARETLDELFTASERRLAFYFLLGSMDQESRP